MDYKSIKSKFLKNGFIKDVTVTTVGQIVVMLVSFCLNKVVSNEVSVEDFGVYNLARKAASVLSYVMIAAMGIAIPKYLAEHIEKKDDKAVARYTLASLLIVCASCFVCSALALIFPKPVTMLIFDDLRYGSYIVPIVVFAVTSTFFTYTCSYFRGVGDFKKYNAYQILMQLAILLVAVFANGNLIWLFVGWGVAYAVFCIVVFLPVTHNKIQEAKPLQWNNLKVPVCELLRYGLPRIPGEFVLFAYHLLPLAIVLRKFGMEQSSFFSVAISITSTVTPLFNFVGVVLLPMASKSVVSGEIKGLNRSLKVLSALYLVLSACVIGAVELLPKFVISVLFSNEYYEATAIVRIVIVSIIPNAVYLLLRNPIDGISRTPYNTYSLCISFVFTVVAMWLSADIYTCAWAYVMGYGVMAIMSFVFWRLTLRKLKKKGIGL